MNEIKLTTKQAEGLESFVERHMALCYEELNGEAVPQEWSSYDPYCGCTTCDSREYLMATFDWLKTNGIVDIYVEDGVKDESATLF